MTKPPSTELQLQPCEHCGQHFMPLPQLRGMCPGCLLLQAIPHRPDRDRTRPRFVAPHVDDLAPLFPQLSIEQLIGLGGMSAVYRAQQTTLGRTVALKILPRELAELKGRIERFQREAELLARLNHANIVQVYDSGTAGGWSYILMEYVEGFNLRGYLGGNRLPEADAVQIILGICSALQYAHRCGVVHRDIKPENILLSPNGEIKLVDFGLAISPVNNSHGVDSHGESEGVGTPQYAAPEQLTQSVTAVDRRADIYSLGILFYEMLCGRLPSNIFALSPQNNERPSPLMNIVGRAISPSPASRFASVADFRSAVIAAAEGQRTSGSEPSHIQAWAPLSGIGHSRARLAELSLSVLALCATLIGLIGIGNLLDWFRNTGPYPAQLTFGFPMFAIATATSCALAILFARRNVSCAESWHALRWTQMPSLVPLVIIYSLPITIILAGPAIPLWLIAHTPKLSGTFDWTFAGRAFSESDLQSYWTPYWYRVLGTCLLSVGLWNGFLSYLATRLPISLTGAFRPWDEREVLAWVRRASVFIAVLCAAWGFIFLAL